VTYLSDSSDQLAITLPCLYLILLIRPPSKKAHVEKLTLKQAVEEAKLASVSLLNEKERISTLMWVWTLLALQNQQVSIFIIWLLILVEGNNNPPITITIIIFNTNTKEGLECYAFGGTSTLCVGHVINFKAFFLLPKTWCLVDSSPNPQLNLLEVKTIISISPKTFFSENNNTKRFPNTL